MHFIAPDKHTRRAFLRRSSQLALAGGAMPFAVNLAALGEAAAAGATDYKAIVCVFLQGGNDYANTVVTYDEASHARYAAIRAAGAGGAAGGIVLSRPGLEATVLAPAQPLAGGRQYALHPSMPGLAGLFNSGKAAVQLNVGPLVVPITKVQYFGNNRTRYPIPPKLFSHNDQQSIWQSSSPEGSTIGWGGNIGDLALSSNANSLFTCISVAGNSVFLAGDQALQYQCSTAGAIPVRPLKQGLIWEPGMIAAFRAMILQERPHELENEYNKVMRRAVAAESQVSAGLGSVSLATPFPAGSLAAQLKVVARLIGARQALGNTRQVFMVQLGGFDLHDNLVARQPGLLQQLSEAITAFYQATVELGVADQVTTFTASDFGRTLTSNGDGSDHGWGSHHFVVGGAVRGRAFYGTPPAVSIGSTAAPEDQSHVGQGRLLPTTSVDQYAATLAQWLGVPASRLPELLPNLHNFGDGSMLPGYPVNLGFMA